MTQFIDKVAVLKEELRALEVERGEYLNDRPGDIASVFLQKIDGEIEEHRIEIIALGGDPDF